MRLWILLVRVSCASGVSLSNTQCLGQAREEQRVRIMVLIGLFTDRRDPIRFGDRDWTERMLQEQAVLCAVVLFPFSVVLGHLCMRVSVRPWLSFIASDLWNGLVKILVADMVMDTLLPSLQCIPLEDEEDTLMEWTLQSLGLAACPHYVQPPSVHAQGILFAMRILAIALGVYLGEGFCPIGLTGGIATGKSTVAKQLVHGMPIEPQEKEEETNKTTNDTNDSKGDAQKEEEEEREDVVNGTVFLVDADKIAHEILLKDSPGSVYPKIVKAFGKDILNPETKEIDRPKLGQLVFGSNDRAKRRLLNGITHSKIRFVLLSRLLYGLYASSAHLVIADIPLLMESPWIMRVLFGFVVVVSCRNPDQQFERLALRNPHLSEEECRERIASQMDIRVKAQRAQIVLDNSGPPTDLPELVEQAREEMMNRIYGVGLSTFQMILLLGLVVPTTIYYKLQQQEQQGS